MTTKTAKELVEEWAEALEDIAYMKSWNVNNRPMDMVSIAIKALSSKQALLDMVGDGVQTKIGFPTGIYDRTGKQINVGDRLRFYPCEATPATNDGCIWDGTVTFEDGVFTVSIQDAAQYQNPTKWEMKHDWIKSRHWSCIVGYGEFGTWNVHRKSLCHIDNGFGSNQEHYERLYKPLAEKIGYGKRFINAEILPTPPQEEDKGDE